MLQLPSCKGVTVSLDETGAMPSLVVTVPAGLKLPPAFVRLCHTAAGNHGATLEWKAAS